MDVVDMRIGIGFDAHKIVKNRELYLGGVKIDENFGLEGHSDADVLLHAIMDAMLGASSLQDIGHHFPSDNNEYQGANSLELLKKVNQLIKKKGKRVVNVDSVVICEKPLISEYAGIMRKNISEVLGVEEDAVSVKGKSTERMGFTGRGEGISAISTVLIDEL
jgi:2-C-methyl-D-erythritol 2,4-cyclodiphosphate synthase